MKINHESNIWDLHQHTCKCTKVSKAYKGLTVKEYVSKLNDIYRSYPDLKLISFTDHNSINTEIYHEFKSVNSLISVVPGVELDVRFSASTDSKHLLLYFDDSKNDLNEIANIINGIVDKHKITSENPIDFSVLVTNLVDNKLTFLLSPHAFKQGKRSINHEWTSEESNLSAKKYANQFFCFWETSGYKEINNAKVFLEEFLKDNEVSIVSFSDSTSYEDVKAYLDHPPVYFNSLNTFRGIQLVGTDSSRIKNIKEKIDSIDKNKNIGKIIFNGEVIELSRKLNSIIGGRGSGKSILIDMVASKTKSIDIVDSKRLEYLKNHNCELFDMDGQKITNEFEIDYFNQNYVSRIFDGKTTNQELNRYFSREFDSIEDIDSSSELLEIKTTFNNGFNTDNTEPIKENIGNLIEVYTPLQKSNIDIGFKKSLLENLTIIDEFDIEKQLKEIKKSSIIPKQILEQPEIVTAINTFQKSIIEGIFNYNQNILNTDYLFDRFLSNYFIYKEGKTKESKLKATTEKIIKYKINSVLSCHIDRVNLVNALLETEMSCKFLITKNSKNSNEALKNYQFTKEITIEKPIDFFLRVLSSYVSKRTYNKSLTYDNFLIVAHDYCTNISEYLTPSKTVTELDQELRDFKLLVHQRNNIYYNNKLIDNESPGTKTNILMEYIVNSKNGIPLLIDQPEDNIDNQTIYNKLTDWFSQLKNNRQIIVVSHDANIVINADAENLILASQESEGKFKYNYGALEYGSNLEKAAQILDGGVKAVKRRLNKYGDE